MPFAKPAILMRGMVLSRDYLEQCETFILGWMLWDLMGNPAFEKSSRRSPKVSRSRANRLSDSRQELQIKDFLHALRVSPEFI